MTRGWAIATAIARRAERGAALHGLAWNFYIWVAGVVTRLRAAAARIVRNAARLVRLGFMPRRPPVRGPFPDIADHVVEAVAIRRKCRDRRRARKTVLAQILGREAALPCA